MLKILVEESREKTLMCDTEKFSICTQTLVCRNRAFPGEEDTKLHRRQDEVSKVRARASLTF